MAVRKFYYVIYMLHIPELLNIPYNTIGLSGAERDIIQNITQNGNHSINEKEAFNFKL